MRGRILFAAVLLLAGCEDKNSLIYKVHEGQPALVRISDEGLCSGQSTLACRADYEVKFHKENGIWETCGPNRLSGNPRMCNSQYDSPSGKKGELNLWGVGLTFDNAGEVRHANGGQKAGTIRLMPAAAP